MRRIVICPRILPPDLEALSEMALDMRWSWNHEADALWERVDRELWETTGNPWLILQSVSSAGLAALARDIQWLLPRLKKDPLWGFAPFPPDRVRAAPPRSELICTHAKRLLTLAIRVCACALTALAGVLKIVLD